MQDARTRAALLVICLACLLGSGYILLTGRQAAPPPIVLSAPPPGPASDPAPADTPHGKMPLAVTVPKPPARVYVDVAGAVRRPALYLLPPNSRVMQAVRAAGGPTSTADLDAVNLAQPVTDGEKVFVPERVAAISPALASVPAASVHSSRREHTAKAGAKEEAGGKLKEGSSEQIGLNSATAEQLERLPTIGPSMATRILAYRQQAGGFSKVEDLMLVTGIGPKKFAKIAPFVSLN